MRLKGKSVVAAFAIVATLVAACGPAGAPVTQVPARSEPTDAHPPRCWCSQLQHPLHQQPPRRWLFPNGHPRESTARWSMITVRNGS
jgi:hypothetical protein